MTQKEFDAAANALRHLRDSEMPWYARSSVTEEVIEKVIWAVLGAAEKARGVEPPTLSTKDIKPLEP